jgi:6-phosphogluconolactonase
MIRFDFHKGNSTTVLPSFDGRFLYLSDPGLRGVNLFALDAQGIPTHVDGVPFPNPADEPFSPNNLRIEAAGRFLFAANYLSDSISVFSIASDGTLTPVEGAPFATGAVGGGLQSITVYPRS